MSTHNMPFINIRKENLPKLSQICMGWVFSEGLKNEFETAVVNEPSVFEPLKFYCIFSFFFFIYYLCYNYYFYYFFCRQTT